MADDLSSTEKIKVKSTLLDIKAEVDKFLNSNNIDTVEFHTEDIFKNRLNLSVPNISDEKMDEEDSAFASKDMMNSQNSQRSSVNKQISLAIEIKEES